MDDRQSELNIPKDNSENNSPTISRRNFLQKVGGVLGLVAFEATPLKHLKSPEKNLNQQEIFSEIEQPTVCVLGKSEEDPESFPEPAEQKPPEPIDEKTSLLEKTFTQKELSSHNIRVFGTPEFGLTFLRTALESDNLISRVYQDAERFKTNSIYPAISLEFYFIDFETITTGAPIPDGIKEQVMARVRQAEKSAGKEGMINGMFYSYGQWSADPSFDIQDSETGVILKNEQAIHQTLRIIIATKGGQLRPNITQAFPGVTDVTDLPVEVALSVSELQKTGQGNVPRSNNRPKIQLFGHILAHEMRHAFNFLQQNPLSRKESYENLESELQVDVLSLRELEEAHQTLEETGDASKYYRVVLTPDGPYQTRDFSSDPVI